MKSNALKFLSIATVVSFTKFEPVCAFLGCVKLSSNGNGPPIIPLPVLTLTQISDRRPHESNQLLFLSNSEQNDAANDNLDDEDDDDEVETETLAREATSAVNVLGSPLCACCSNVRGSGVGTGFYRNGYCATGPQDLGRHTVCVQVTDEFLNFSQAVGNDLSTPMPQYLFPGLKDGDIWCLCAQRWEQAYLAGKAPKLYLKATHEKTLDFVSFDVLRHYAIDQSEADKDLNSLNEQRERLNKLL